MNTRLSFSLALALLAALPVLPVVAQSSLLRGAAQLSGVAQLSEPAVLPADALFEAVLLDIAVADAPSLELGRVLLPAAGSGPFRFSIPYRRGDITPLGRYMVRATLRQGERLLFTTDTITPVLTGQPMPPLTLRLVSVKGAAPEPRRRLRGLFRYLADAPSFRLCGTEQTLPVAMEGDYLHLERAYLQALPPGAAGRPLLVELEGLISQRPSAEPGRPPQPTLVVERALGVPRDQPCEPLPAALNPGAQAPPL